MKLWEAILFGASLRPSTKHSWCDKSGSCAVGAALEAEGIEIAKDGEHPIDQIHAQWPWTLRKAEKCEMLDGAPWTSRHSKIRIPTIAMQLHHHHCQGISRERIALEFVKPLEDALEVRADAALPCD